MEDAASDPDSRSEPEEDAGLRTVDIPPMGMSPQMGATQTKKKTKFRRKPDPNNSVVKTDARPSIPIAESKSAGKQLRSEYLAGCEHDHDVAAFTNQMREIFAFVTRVVSIDSHDARKDPRA